MAKRTSERENGQLREKVAALQQETAQQRDVNATLAKEKDLLKAEVAKAELDKNAAEADLMVASEKLAEGATMTMVTEEKQVKNEHKQQ